MTSGKEVGSTRGDFVRLFEGASSAGLGDGDLLGRFVARRDEAAFEALVARLGPMVLGVCRRMLADPHDVDDAFQATFLVLVRRAGSIRDRHVVSTWLYEVAVRVARRARADSARRADRERQAAVADAGEEQEPRVERSEVRAWIDEEIGRLPESHRRLIVLCDVEGLTREEAAARLGWTANMVRGRLERARARLRQRLTRRGLAPSGASLVLALPPAVPRISLVAATVRGALGGAGSASACSLSIGVIRMMILARWKVVVSVLVSALGVGTALATVAARLEDGGKDRPMLVKAPAQEDASVLVAPPAKKPSGRRLPDLDKAAPSGKMVRQRPRRDANDTRPSMEGAPKAVPVRVTGLIRGLDEVPVVGATVVVLAHQSRDDPNFVDQTIEAGRATTGADGRYSFPAVVIPTSRYHNHPDGATPFIQFQVVAQAPGFGFGWHRWNSMFAVPTPDPDDTQGRLELNTPVTADIYLRPEATLKGRVIDEASNPVAGLKIQVRDIGLLDERGMETTVQTSVNPGLMPNGLGLATTDPDGRFRLSGLPMESCSWLFFEQPDANYRRALYASTSAEAETKHARPDNHNGREPHDVYPADMTVTMATPRRLEVRVVASDDGKPVPDVRVGSGAGTLATGVSSDGMTDAEGKAALHLPAGRYRYLSADPTSVDSRYLRTYLRPLVVTADSAVQPIELKMRVGAELLIEVVDADTGQGIPNVLLDINPGSPGGGWSRLWKSSVFFTPGTPTDAAGQVRAVLDPQPGVTYRVRVAGVGLETAVDPRDLGAPPPPITSGPEAREIPYEAVNAMSGPFEPKAGTPTRLRFTLRKKK